MGEILTWSIFQEKLKNAINHNSQKDRQVLNILIKNNPEIFFKPYNNGFSAFEQIVVLGKKEILIDLINNVDFSKINFLNNKKQNVLHILFQGVLPFENDFEFMIKNLAKNQKSYNFLINQEDIYQEKPIAKIINNSNSINKEKLFAFLFNNNLLPEAFDFDFLSMIKIINETKLLKSFLNKYPDLINLNDKTHKYSFFIYLSLDYDHLNHLLDFNDLLNNYRPKSFSDIKCLITNQRNVFNHNDSHDLFKKIINLFCKSHPNLLVSEDYSESAWQLAFRYDLEDELIIKIARSTPHLTLRFKDTKVIDYIKKYNDKKLHLVDIIFDERTIDNSLNNYDSKTDKTSKIKKI